MSKYSIGQLRGAYAAGRRDAMGEAPSLPRTLSDRKERNIATFLEWISSHIGKCGVHSLHRSHPEIEAVYSWISLLHASSGRIAVEIADDRFEREFDGLDSESRCYLQRCLSCAIEEWYARAESVQRELAKGGAA